MIKALTLWQPYAGAVACGFKKFETRSWSTHHRGLLAIHAAQRPLTKQDEALAAQYHLPVLAFGAVVALVDLQECIEMTQDFIAQQTQQERDFGDWRVGRFAWQLQLVERLDPAIPALASKGCGTGLART